MKFLARLKSRGKKRGKLFRYGWKISLALLIASGGFALLLFYGAWAASFDMKKVGAMPERNTVFDVDGKIYSRLSGSAKEGASSITQQLARNSLPLGGRNLSRKLLEAMVAFRIEHEFTKKQILELYVNRIYFGSGCYGVETASQAYFGKHAKDLSLPEAALLAGLIRSPNRFSPLKNPE